MPIKITESTEINSADILDESELKTEFVKRETAFDIAISFIDYQNCDTVADFIYPKRAEQIYRELNIKTKGDLIASMTYVEDSSNSSSKEVENTINTMNGIISDYLLTLSNEDYLKFAVSYYDEDFSLDISYIEN